MNEPVTATETCSAQLVMLDQQLALSAYLQALLRPAPEAVVAEAEAVPALATGAETTPVAIPETSLAEEVTTTVSDKGELESPQESAPVPAAAAMAYPDWAQGEFQCLLFRVAGLTLALPLARLNGVMPWDAAAVTAMPNHQPWFLGLREHLGHQVKLIDVAKVILPPERWPQTGSDADAQAYGKVILIDDGRWGLVCSEVAEVIVLSHEAVKWRKRESCRAGSRPWLAGTVIDHMCALIDSDVFAGMLGGDGPEPA